MQGVREGMLDKMISMRAVILGCAGTGKSTLARRLGEVTGAKVICLDDIWQPTWTDTDVPTFRAILEEAHAGETWISDGNFSQATFDLRLPRATLVIWMERPRIVCAWRAILRVFKSGEPHRFKNLGKVLKFIWNFNRINRPRIELLRKKFGPEVPVVSLSNDLDIERFLGSKGGTSN